MDDKSKEQPSIPKYIGGNCFHLAENGSFASKSHASSSIIGYSNDPTHTPPNPFESFGANSSLSTMTSPKHGYSSYQGPSPNNTPPFPPLRVSMNTSSARVLPFLCHFPPDDEHTHLDTPTMQDLQPSSHSSTGINFTETALARSVFEQHSNDIAVLVIMAIGLTENDSTSKPLLDVHNDDLFDPKKNSSLPHNKLRNPFKHALLDEIVRRKVIKRDNTKTNKQKNKNMLLEWLKDNPRTNTDDLQFLHAEADNLKQKLKNGLESNTSTMTGSGNKQWVGETPRVRLIECVLDEDIRTLLVKDRAALSREELDGRNCASVARPDIWQLVADKWNDPTFCPVANVYPGLHPDYKNRMDISHHAVKYMGKLNAQKANNNKYVIT